jgi:hypothetical protein
VPLVEFSREYPSPTLWQLADFPGIGSVSDQLIIASIEGVREAIFREATILVRKFSHCRSIVQIAAAQGRSTWASIGAYEACFYGAKAFCYLLGFASVGRNSPFFIDVFFENEQEKRKRIAEERYDMKFHKLPERLTHAILWGLIERLINTTTFDANLSEQKAALRAIDWADFSNFRNSLMYDGAYWTKLDVYEECDLITLISDISIYRAASHARNFETLPFGKEYFRCMSLLGSTLALMFSDLARLAPALATEAVAVQL